MLKCLFGELATAATRFAAAILCWLPSRCGCTASSGVQRYTCRRARNSRLPGPSAQNHAHTDPTEGSAAFAAVSLSSDRARHVPDRATVRRTCGNLKRMQAFCFSRFHVEIGSHVVTTALGAPKS
eukprot:6795143-Prymnesium_polylepis.1